MSSIFSHTSQSFAHYILSHLGKGERHAKLLYKEFFQKGTFTGSDPAFKNAQKLLQEIIALTDFSLPSLSAKLEEGETGKILIKTHDDLEIEAVLLPMRAGWTLCLSSQIGCRMGCRFCETAKMGLLRHLEVPEIVSQLFHARHTLRAPIRNLVFMGMGEPLDNFENVMRAITIFNDPFGFNLAPSHITVSTSGYVDRIYDLMKAQVPRVRLAVSINASHDDQRNRLMPVNRRFDMNALKMAMSAYCQHFKSKIFIEYVLIEGRNDSLEDARMLAQYLRDLDVTINLIPYNPQRNSRFKSSDSERIMQFCSLLKEEGYLTFVRSTFGQKIMAACGQLGNRPFT